MNKESVALFYIPYIMLMGIIIYIERAFKYTKEERIIVNKIEGLRRYIKDFSILNEKDKIEYVYLWEDYFILAIALGLNKETINYFYNYGKKQESNLANSLRNRRYIDFYVDTCTSFYGFRSAYRSNEVSSFFTEVQGNFSGGSGSGGGGGRWPEEADISKIL